MSMSSTAPNAISKSLAPPTWNSRVFTSNRSATTNNHVREIQRRGPPLHLHGSSRRHYGKIQEYWVAASSRRHSQGEPGDIPKCELVEAALKACSPLAGEPSHGEPGHRRDSPRCEGKTRARRSSGNCEEAPYR